MCTLRGDEILSARARTFGCTRREMRDMATGRAKHIWVGWVTGLASTARTSVGTPRLCAMDDLARWARWSIPGVVCGRLGAKPPDRNNRNMRRKTQMRRGCGRPLTPTGRYAANTLLIVKVPVTRATLQTSKQQPGLDQIHGSYRHELKAACASVLFRMSTCGFLVLLFKMVASTHLPDPSQVLPA